MNKRSLGLWGTWGLAGALALATLGGCSVQSDPVPEPSADAAPTPGLDDGSATVDAPAGGNSGNGAATTPDNTTAGDTTPDNTAMGGAAGTGADVMPPTTGDGTTTIDDAPAADILAGDYYPMVDGGHWTYRHEGGNQAWNEEVSMAATQHAGAAAWQVRDTPGPSGSHTVSIFVQDGGQVLRVRKEVSTGTLVELTAEYVPGFVRFDDAWLAMAAGDSATLGYDRTEMDATGAIVREGPREHVFEFVAGPVAVSVPAGSFDDCIQVRRNRVRAPGSAAAEGDVKSFWFCPDVGKVKEVDEGIGKSEVLLTCSLPACGG